MQDIGTTLDDLQWSAVLRSVSALETFRKRYQTISVHRIVEFLILDPFFPRTVCFCIRGANDSLHQITGSNAETYQNEPERLLGQLHSELIYSDVDTIINQGLHELIDRLQIRLNETGAAIHETFFEMRPVESSQQQSQFQ